MDKSTIEKILNDALDELYKNDQKLIFNEKIKGNRTHCHSSERSIVHKYAIYFEKLIKDKSNNDESNNDCEYRVDIEYNQNIDRLKILTSRPNGAYPDMILHKRGTNVHNILVVEFKTWWNKKKIDKDIEKLKDFCRQTGEYRYKYGVSIVLEKRRKDAQLNFIYPPAQS